MSSLDILILTPYQIEGLQIHSVGRFFISLIVSIVVQKLFSLMWSQIFMCVCVRVCVLLVLYPPIIVKTHVKEGF